MNAQQLKNAILQEAIEGRLVPQDPNDDPASILLERIRAEKERLVKEGKLKKKDLEVKPISEEEIPFEIPKGWIWVRWGELGEYKKGPFGSSLTKSMFVSKSDEAIKVYEQKNAIQKDFSLGDYYISKEKYDTMIGFTVCPGDIIVSCAGTIGETYLLPSEAPIGIINQALMRAKLHLDSIIPYWLLHFQYVLLIENKLKGSGSAIKNIPPFEVLKAMPVPLPPLAEQKRIVAKIEELLPKVEKYGKAQDELNKLNEELPELLKKSILQEAIEGRLVPQDPNDEPASILLEKIREEKKQLVKAGKLKKKDLEEKTISEDEIPFDIPESWEWVRMSQISLDSADGPFGSNLKREHYTLNKEVRIIQLSNIGEEGWRDENVKYTTFEHLTNISRSEAFANDIIIAKMMPAGRAIICPSNDKKYVLSSDAVRFDFSDHLFRKYLYYAINSNVFKDQVYGEVQGITRVRTSLSKLRTYLLPIPPLAEQKRIVAKIEELLQKIDGLKK